MGERWEAFAAYNLDRARTPSAKTARRMLMKQVGVPVIPPRTSRGLPFPRP
jgi:hypothetical protein